MATLATIVAGLAIAGALASWIAGVVFYLHTLRSIAGPDARQLKWQAVVGWLFVLKRLQGAAAENASKVNKAVVAFLACVMIAVAAISVATNLSRVSS